jgi:hypothetical protein
VHFEPNRYRKFGIAATGKARGFQNPDKAKIETAAATERATSRTHPSRPKSKSAPTGSSDAQFRLFPFASIFWN